MKSLTPQATARIRSGGPYFPHSTLKLAEFAQLLKVSKRTVVRRMRNLDVRRLEKVNYDISFDQIADAFHVATERLIKVAHGEDRIITRQEAMQETGTKRRNLFTRRGYPALLRAGRFLRYSFNDVNNHHIRYWVR